MWHYVLHSYKGIVDSGFLFVFSLFCKDKGCLDQVLRLYFGTEVQELLWFLQAINARSDNKMMQSEGMFFFF